jgi:tyrosyl-tRNA synthetase
VYTSPLRTYLSKKVSSLFGEFLADLRNVIQLLEARGFIDQMTSPELRAHVEKPARVYVGFDPSADSLHLGNLLGIIALKWFEKCGHQPIALVGGATGRIGDPSGKSSERNLLSDADLAKNKAGIWSVLQRLLPSARLVDNGDWLGAFSMLDFLRDVGKYFRVGPMLAKESVRARMEAEEGLSFTEFSYQILQAYDFHYLQSTEGVTVQMGGSDQWGNITAGIEFNRKKGGGTIYGLTFPLLTRSDGKKFGKSEEGAVWLSADKISPYEFYQYLIRIPDADVIKMLRMLTFLEMEEIETIARHMGEAGYVPNTAQRRLAEEVTRFVHGEEGVRAALEVTRQIAPGAEARLSASAIEALGSEVPCAEVGRGEGVGIKIADLMVKVGLLSSKGEAVRLIKNGGAYLNNQRIEDPAYCLEIDDWIDGKFAVVSAGKKKKIVLKMV